MNIDFDRLKERAGELAQAGVSKAKELTDAGMAKAKQLTEIGKLKVRNSSERDAIRRAYTELGKLYYAERGSAPEPGYADLCQKVSQARARIDYNNERIADIKAAGQLTDQEVESACFEQDSDDGQSEDGGAGDDPQV
ncbi:MAG TPA: serine proteinase [Candidatus Enterenecus merdae]|nr:serine proteinase [Candidatus Enterenecus merdae]